MTGTTLLAIATLLANPGHARGCGDGWMFENLVATPNVKAQLRAAYVEAHPGATVRAPLAGHTYYGTYSGTRYAVATFDSYPTIFRTDDRGRWRVRSDTRGRICTNVVPVDLVHHAWWLVPLGGGCYAEPR